MTHREKALQIMAANANCAQSVLGAFADELGLTEEQAMGISFCFFSGMRKADVCGAVSGALMVIGMKYGQKKAGDITTRSNGARIQDDFLKRFAEANGSCLCRDLLGVDISIPEKAEYARNQGMFKEVCPCLVASAVDILEQILSENS